LPVCAYPIDRNSPTMPIVVFIICITWSDGHGSSLILP
jgi:hypothetical protein